MIGRHSSGRWYRWHRPSSLCPRCVRTAFQIPFDATVRISLDTNLCMISERGYDTQGGAK